MSSRFLWLMICLKYKKGSSPLIFYYSFCILNSEERYFSRRTLAVIILNKNVWCYWNVYIYFHFSFSLFTLIKFKLTHSVSSISLFYGHIHNSIIRIYIIPFFPMFLFPLSFSIIIFKFLPFFLIFKKYLVISKCTESMEVIKMVRISNVNLKNCMVLFFPILGH